MNAYREIVGDDIIEELYLLSEKLSETVIQNINSTSMGGGVAEILNNIVPLLKDLGVDARWDVIKGDEKFFQVTKKMHNALHAVKETFTESSFKHFLKINSQNAKKHWSFTGISYSFMILSLLPSLSEGKRLAGNGRGAVILIFLILIKKSGFFYNSLSNAMIVQFFQHRLLQDHFPSGKC